MNVQQRSLISNRRKCKKLKLQKNRLKKPESAKFFPFSAFNKFFENKKNEEDTRKAKEWYFNLLLLLKNLGINFYLITDILSCLFLTQQLFEHLRIFLLYFSTVTFGFFTVAFGNIFQTLYQFK